MKIAILGRQPELSLAELECLFGSAVRPFGSEAALIDSNEVNLDRLGGTIKLAEVTDQLDTASWPKLQAYLTALPRPTDAGKLRLGLSVYGLGLSDRQVLAAGLEIKRAWKPLAVRVVPTKGPVVSTATALHNRLLAADGVDYLVVTDGHSTVIGRAEQIQDIEGYTARDQARPSRSAKIGMLPPKLAQILINLAAPQPEVTILDPFCGSGVILQEALLAGHPVIGSDNNPEMTSAAQDNLDWLAQSHSALPKFTLQTVDATNGQWPPPIGAVVTEAYLGPPLSKLDPKSLAQIKPEISQLAIKFLANLHSQLTPDTPVVMCLPAWRASNHFERLDILDQIRSLGYTFKQFSRSGKPLIYWRSGQIVGRDILSLRRS